MHMSWSRLHSGLVYTSSKYLGFCRKYLGRRVLSNCFPPHHGSPKISYKRFIRLGHGTCYASNIKSAAEMEDQNVSSHGRATSKRNCREVSEIRHVPPTIHHRLARGIRGGS